MTNLGPFDITTKLGKVWANPTSAEHVYLSFSVGSRHEEPLTVRGVRYTGSIHAYKWLDGNWYVGQEFSTRNHVSGRPELGGIKEPSTNYERRNSLYLSRVDNCLKDASEPARNTVAQVVIEAFRLWAWTHPDVFVEADERFRTDERQKRQDRIIELQAEIAKLQAEITALTGEEL